MKETIIKIAKQLSDMDITDLTDAERKIVNILCGKGFMEIINGITKSINKENNAE